MGNIVGGLFGKSQGKSTTTTQAPIRPDPFNLLTPNAGLQVGPGGSALTAPGLQGGPIFRNNARTGFNTILGDVTNDIGTLRGLENPFIRARVDPLRRQAAQARSDLERGLGRRGVFGTLQRQELEAFDEGVNRQLGEAESLATRDAQDAILSRQGLQQMLTANIADLGERDVQQVLSELGLSLAAQDVFLRNTISGGSVKTGSGTDSGDVRGGIGDIATAAGLASSFFSDRRLKTNIRRIGQTPKGLNVYAFNYVWGEPSIGVMADEVESVMPEAVGTHPSGYKVVDYGRIG